jgi:hypothetical protein
MEYHPVSCNREEPLVSRGAVSVYKASLVLKTTPANFALKKYCFTKSARALCAHNASYGRKPLVWLNVEKRQSYFARGMVPVGYPLLNVDFILNKQCSFPAKTRSNLQN